MTTEDKSQMPMFSPEDEQETQKLPDHPRMNGTLKVSHKWTGFQGKTLWDWLQLLGVLAIPLVVVGATPLFGIQQANLANQQHDNDQKIASQQREANRQQTLDQQRQAILVAFQDNMKDLLLHQGLLTSKPTDEIRVIARTETLSAMRQLDWKRNGFLLQFLRDSHLIGFDKSSIVSFVNADLDSSDLYNASFSGFDLTYVTLRFANLSESYLNITNLTGANFFHANLTKAHLVRTKLTSALFSGANLTSAQLIGANLTGAFLAGANFFNANLSGANLSGALYLTQQQLDQVHSCKNAILPPGLTCHHNL